MTPWPHRVAQLVEACYAIDDLDRFPIALLEAAMEAVPCEIAAYNDVDPLTNRIVGVAIPDGILWDDLFRVWQEHGHQNPLYQRALLGDVGPYTFSDYLTQDELHELPLYQEMYRRLGTEYQLAFALASPSPQVVAVTLNRERSDFTAEERETIRLALPHMTRAYDSARAAAGLRRDRARIAEALELAGLALLVLRDGEIVDLGQPALDLLAAAGIAAEAGAEVPAALTEALQRGALPAGDVAVRATDVSDGTVVVLERRAQARLLSPREEQVMDLAAAGFTPKEIAVRLGIAPRTVHKHLENVYAKLGVSNLIAALAALRERAS